MVLALVLLLLAPCSLVSSARQWKLSWSDEFDSPAGLDTKTWNVRTNQSHCCSPFGGNGELQLYLPDEAFVDDGSLHLRTRRRAATDPAGKRWNYTSGWIDTKGHFAQKQGRFEANCSLPSRKATGIWPAFWLMPSDPKQCWPTGGEVDVFEFNGNWIEDEIFGSYHWGLACGKDKAPLPGKGVSPKTSTTKTSSTTKAKNDWQEEYHVYAVEWTADGIDYFLDDTLYFSVKASAVSMPTSPMYIIFDQAVDSWLFPPSAGPGDYNGADGVELKVDYVRVYTEVTSEEKS